MKTSYVTRRDWLKQSALATGAMITGAAFTTESKAMPAFGMTPFEGVHHLRETYHRAPATDLSQLKARLLANENPWDLRKRQSQPSPKVQAVETGTYIIVRWK